MNVPQPDRATIYRTRLDGLMAERALLADKLGRTARAGESETKLADQVRQADADIERTRITLEAIERDAAADASQRQGEEAAHVTAQLERKRAAVASKARAFEAALLGQPVQHWLDYVAELEDCIEAHRKHSRPTPEGLFHRPVKVWGNVLSRFLRDTGESPVPALRSSAQPKTLTDLAGPDPRPGATPEDQRSL